MVKERDPHHVPPVAVDANTHPVRERRSFGASRTMLGALTMACAVSVNLVMKKDEIGLADGQETTDAQGPASDEDFTPITPSVVAAGSPELNPTEPVFFQIDEGERARIFNLEQSEPKNNMPFDSKPPGGCKAPEYLENGEIKYTMIGCGRDFDGNSLFLGPSDAEGATIISNPEETDKYKLFRHADGTLILSKINPEIPDLAAISVLPEGEPATITTIIKTGGELQSKILHAGETIEVIENGLKRTIELNKPMTLLYAVAGTATIQQKIGDKIHTNEIKEKGAILVYLQPDLPTVQQGVEGGCEITILAPDNNESKIPSPANGAILILVAGAIIAVTRRIN